jgi:hypothetical protein
MQIGMPAAAVAASVATAGAARSLDSLPATRSQLEMQAKMPAAAAFAATTAGAAGAVGAADSTVVPATLKKRHAQSVAMIVDFLREWLNSFRNAPPLELICRHFASTTQSSIVQNLLQIARVHLKTDIGTKKLSQKKKKATT